MRGTQSALGEGDKTQLLLKGEERLASLRDRLR